MTRKWWQVWKREPSSEVIEAKKKFEQVVKDDKRVDNLVRRTDAILAENNLADAVIQALKAR